MTQSVPLLHEHRPTTEPHDARSSVTEFSMEKRISKARFLDRRTEGVQWRRFPITYYYLYLLRHVSLNNIGATEIQ